MLLLAEAHKQSTLLRRQNVKHLLKVSLTSRKMFRVLYWILFCLYSGLSWSIFTAQSCFTTEIAAFEVASFSARTETRDLTCNAYLSLGTPDCKALIGLKGTSQAS